MNQKKPVELSVEPAKGYVMIRLDWYKIIFAAIIIFTVVTRFSGLGNKPYHHDESLYATYSWYLYEGRGYKYDPMMHGPFMFYLDAALFTLFGPGDFIARSSSALFGLALVCCTMLLRRQLGKIGSLVAATLFAVSPTFMYFSRFFREDIFVAFWAFLTVALFMNYSDTRRRGYLFGTAAALAFMFCVKENSYMFLFIFASFIVGMLLFEKFFMRAASAPVRTEFLPPGAHGISLIDGLIFIGIFFGIFYIFFTSFFSNSPGFIDGLYRKSLGYWIHQDKIQRIKGAFTHFCPIAIVYELPLLVIIASGIIALLKERRVSRLILIVGSALAIPLMLFWHQTLSSDPWDTRLHMTSSMHIVFALYVFAIGLTATCHYLKDGRRFPAFLAYWSWISILLYSYAGEKVPWLLMHILIPVILWASLFLGEFIQSERFRRMTRAYSVLLAVGLLLFLQASLRLCFINEANPVETMVYTQTSVDIKKSLKTIADFAESSGKGLKFPLGIQGDSTWPYTWYLRDYKEWFQPGTLANASKAVVVVDWEKRRDFSSVLDPNYRIERLKLREWWVPDPVSSLKDPVRAWLRYYFWRELWNPFKRKSPDGEFTATGSQDVAFCVRKDLLGEKLGEAKEVKTEEGAARPSPRIPPKYEIINTVPPLLYFGERGSAKGRFDEPRCLWVDAEGALYVVDTKNHRWQKFGKDGKPLLAVGKQGSGPAEFKEPMGIAVDDSGNVFVADTWNHRIQKFDREGKFLTQWQGGSGGFWAPKGMAFDSKGDLYVVDTGKHRIQKFTKDGKPILVWGDAECRQGEAPGEFSEPVGIVIEKNGVIIPADTKKKQKEVRGDIVYVADTANKRVQKFDIAGKFLGQFAVLGWEEYYTEPFIALDGAGRIWVTDGYNNRIEIFDSSGTLLGLWSGKGFRPGDFNIPKGIFIGDGKVYISDTYNHRLQVFDAKKVFRK
ncbi:MAG: TIGR03663 family protein [Candidatus Aureabacteria bacterium]|nr:TIGR03663 family protein [Candidatus Auribacterota bacterium]